MTGTPVAPTPFSASTAAVTATPIAGYASNDPRCQQWGVQYFTDTAEFDAWAAQPARRDSIIHRWDLDRDTGSWVPR